MAMRTVMGVTVALLGLAACGGDDGAVVTPPGTGAGTVVGRIVDGDSAGGGVMGAGLRLTGGGDPRSGTTDATGTYRLTDVPAGTWNLDVQIPASHRLSVGETGTRTLSVTANGTTNVTPITLGRPKGSATGTVRLEGAAVAAGTVTAARPGFTARTTTPGTGGYAFDGLPVGNWVVEYAPGTQHVLAAGEPGTRAVMIFENQTATLTPFEVAVRPAGPQVVEVRLLSAEFSPATLSIPAGTTVRWINDAPVAHTITPENPNQPGVWQRRETSTQGVVFEHTFPVAGQTYRYRCEPHSVNFQTGMVGVISVT
jgi:plastocyanin